MSAATLKRYRFSTAAQWNACLLAGIDRDPRRERNGIRPLAPYSQPGTLFRSKGARAPAVTRAGEVLWSDDDCAIHRLLLGDDAAQTYAAPPAIARAFRLVATSCGLWVIGHRLDSLHRYDEESLTRLLTVDMPLAPVMDIADGGRGCVIALVEHAGVWQALRIDRWGHIVQTVTLRGLCEPQALVFLRRSQRLVALAGEHQPRLEGFSAEGGWPHFSVPIGANRPYFRAGALGADSLDKVFVAGAESDKFGRREFITIFDGDGDRLGELPWDERDGSVTGIAASRDSLLVTGRAGLRKFDVADVAPDVGASVECKLVTPVLFAPDREDHRRWLRIDATAELPQGSTLEILWIATDDTATRDRLSDLATHDSITASQRLASLLSEPDLRRECTVFHGAARAATERAGTYSVKLFEVAERYVWVFVTLTAARPGVCPACLNCRSVTLAEL